MTDFPMELFSMMFVWKLENNCKKKNRVYFVGQILKC